MPHDLEIDAAAEAMVNAATMQGDMLLHQEAWWYYARIGLEAAERMRVLIREMEQDAIR